MNMVMYFIFTNENRRMKPVEIVLRREGKTENNRGGKSKIYCKQICKYHNESPCTTIIYADKKIF
jgi:hypothetical protein